MRYYFAPLEGLTDSIYRRLHHKYFGGVDRYYMPFLSPTIHRCLTRKEDRELPPAESVPFAAFPQVLTKCAEDFLWAAQVCHDRGYGEVNLNVGCPSGTVTAKLSRAEFYEMQSREYVESAFDGSLPAFVAAFSRSRKLSPGEIEALQKLIDESRG